MAWLPASEAFNMVWRAFLVPPEAFRLTFEEATDLFFRHMVQRAERVANEESSARPTVALWPAFRVPRLPDAAAHCPMAGHMSAPCSIISPRRFSLRPPQLREVHPVHGSGLSFFFEAFFRFQRLGWYAVHVSDDLGNLIEIEAVEDRRVNLCRTCQRLERT